MKKLVLAYSGGLDTSYCAKYLSEVEGFGKYQILLGNICIDKNDSQQNVAK